MADKSSGRKGGDRIRSDPGLLTPLPTTEGPEAMAPAGIRAVVETIEELKSLVAHSPQLDDSGSEVLQQVAQDVSTSIKALRTDLGQREKRQAGCIRDIRETHTAILKGIDDLAETKEAGEAIRGDLEVNARELRDSREAVEHLTRSNDSVATEDARPGNALIRADASCGPRRLARRLHPPRRCPPGQDGEGGRGPCRHALP